MDNHRVLQDSKLKTSSKQPVETKDKVEKPSKKVGEVWTRAQGVTSYKARQEYRSLSYDDDAVLAATPVGGGGDDD
jgi:hypothetical protein